MSTSFPIGVIGYGHRLATLLTHLRHVEPAIEVRAVCDPNPDSVNAARRLAHGVRACATVEDLLRDREIAQVFVGSPNRLHREHACAAMKAGRHVFCEKPLATNLDDCLAIRETVEHTGRSFFFGLVLRYAPLYSRIRTLLDDGQIGQIISVEFNETLGFNHGGFIHQDWRRHRETAGTHMLEKCCHDIDIVNWMVGSRARYAASFGGLRYFLPENQRIADKIGRSLDPEHRPAFQAWPQSSHNPFTSDKDIVDHQVAILEFDNGVRASFHTNCVAAIPERRLLLLGLEGAIRADLNTGTVELQRLGWELPRQVYRSSASIETHFGADLALIESVAAWITRGKPPLTGIDQALDSAITCYGIDAALDERRVVDLSPLWARASINR